VGLFHDFGKYHPEFQRYVRQPRTDNRVDHASAGAHHIRSTAKKGPLLALLANCIAGHHHGLRDEDELIDYLVNRTKGRYKETLKADIPDRFRNVEIPELPSIPKEQREMWARMVFSVLIDADRLDAEAYASPADASFREGIPRLEEVSHLIETFVAGLPFGQDLALQQQRTNLSEACLVAGQLPKGVFSITAPTGSGKTLASLRFAMAHAMKHNLERVIITLPTTSLCAQTAEVCRDIFGSTGVVLEHHSAQRVHWRNRTFSSLAQMNWDAPIIVTTTNMLHDSLLSNDPNWCRKNHRIVNSLIIMDEVQDVGAENISGVIRLLQDLVDQFGVSVLLSSATLPTVVDRPNNWQSFRKVTEICSVTLTNNRVLVEWPALPMTVTTFAELAKDMSKDLSSLAVVHHRQDAIDLTTELDAVLGDTSTVHLSGLLCPAHRRDVLRRIGRRPLTRVVATSVIEVGVDIDFPIVYRAFAGLDRLTQAAGRCNRDGLLGEHGGRLKVFLSENQPSPSLSLGQATAAATVLLNKYGTEINIFDPAVMQEFFDVVYSAMSQARFDKLMEARGRMAFAQIGGDHFRLITEKKYPVVIPYGRGVQLIEKLKAKEEGERSMRSLQEFVVGVYEKEFFALLDAGAVDVVEGRDDSVVCLSDLSLYDDRFGLLKITDKRT
jgi:CRISPR-associated endonuclease/helicase Cas3